MSTLPVIPEELKERARERYEITKERLEKYGEKAYPEWMLNEMKRLINTYEEELELTKKLAEARIENAQLQQRVSELELTADINRKLAVAKEAFINHPGITDIFIRR
jgi:septal ring factor EnvC (AmiA/AmiB activator)